MWLWYLPHAQGRTLRPLLPALEEPWPLPTPVTLQVETVVSITMGGKKGEQRIRRKQKQKGYIPTTPNFQLEISLCPLGLGLGLLPLLRLKHSFKSMHISGVFVIHQ